MTRMVETTKPNWRVLQKGNVYYAQYRTGWFWHYVREFYGEVATRRAFTTAEAAEAYVKTFLDFRAWCRTAPEVVREGKVEL